VTEDQDESYLPRRERRYPFKPLTPQEAVEVRAEIDRVLVGVDAMLWKLCRRSLLGTQHADLCDTVQALRIHLASRSIPAFDSRRGVKLSTFVFRCVQNYLGQVRRSIRRRRGRPDAESIGNVDVAAPDHLHDRAIEGLTGLEATPHEGSDRIFLVQAEYTTLVFGLPPNPLDRAPEISYGNTDATEDYFLDHSKPDPKPVVNSAGDTFESNLSRETGETVLTITVNEATFSPVYFDHFKHTVNENAVTIDGTTYAAGTLKLSPPTPLLRAGPQR
jgi:DNA-directed RNA polymerase specialized sigma24 family protein